jgi:hypothetical protein
MPTLEHNAFVDLFRENPSLAAHLLTLLFHVDVPPHASAAVGEALRACLGPLDRERAAVYFQIVYNALREPARRALEALIMERQTEGKATFPPFAQQLIERGKLEGKLEGKREALLRFLTRAGIALSDSDRVRIDACTDPATLDRWLDNMLGAKTAAEVLT